MSEASWRNHQPPSHETWRGAGSNDAPIPPQDPELRLSIDRTAAACARHGPQFEAMMREKQVMNPKFAFLNGGPFSDYYQQMLMISVQQLQGTQGPSFGSSGMLPRGGPSTSFNNSAPPSNSMPPGPAGSSLPFPSKMPPPGIFPPGQQPPRQSIPSLMDTPEIIAIQKEIEELEQKIIDSENNLLAHKAGLEGILQAHLKTMIRNGETAKIEQLLTNLNLDPSELADLLETMSSSKCSKDTISHAKKWIFEHCHNDQLREIILTYLLNRVKDDESSDFLKLHILYLINDWAFHCQRKKEDNQMKMLSRYVPKMYAYCMEGTNSNELKEKLEGKLLGEWEGRGYFAPAVFKQLLNTSHIVKTDRDIEMASYSSAKESLRANIMATFEGYEQQHESFAVHIQSQIEEKKKKIEELRYGPPKNQPPSLMSINSQNDMNSRRSRFDQTPQERMHNRRPINEEMDRGGDGDDIDGHPFDESCLKPKKSYMVLPAGIMVSQIPLTDFKYDQIDPAKLEMPAKVPPSQRLLAAKDSFYKGLNLDSVVQVEGISDDWDISNFPLEFLEKKLDMKKKFLARLQDIGNTLEDEIENHPNEEEAEIIKKEEERKWNEMVDKMNEKVEEYYATIEGDDYDRNKSRSRSRSRNSRSRSRSRSRSSSRNRKDKSKRKRRSRSSSNSSRSSRSSSSSSSSSSGSSNSSKSYKKEKNERSRSNSRSPRREKTAFNRSPSPEYNQASFSFRAPTAPNAPLPSDNKGAQLMTKMGWSSGRGLGADESGIVDPVDGGEVRDRADQFRGFGSSLDPFEQFRRQRSGNYHERGAQFRERNPN